MKKENWIWMPHVGHFICGSDCRFHLCTYVGNYIVSTVGELWSDSQVRKIHADVHGFVCNEIGDAWDRAYFEKFGFSDIGCDRTYETMVFKAKREKRTPCCPWRMVSGEELDSQGYKDADKAYRGHMKFCLKWSKK